jgi:hypothetical protein
MLSEFEPAGIPWLAPHNKTRFSSLRVTFLEEVIAELEIIILALHMQKNVPS